MAMVVMRARFKLMCKFSDCRYSINMEVVEIISQEQMVELQGSDLLISSDVVVVTMWAGEKG